MPLDAHPLLFLVTVCPFPDIDHVALLEIILHIYGHDLVIFEGNIQAVIVAASYLQVLPWQKTIQAPPPLPKSSINLQLLLAFAFLNIYATISF